MLYGGAAAIFFSVVMVIVVAVGGKGIEGTARMVGYAMIGLSSGVFGFVGYLGVRPKTGRVYRMACFLFAAGLLLQFVSAMILYLRVTALMPSIYLLGTMLAGFLGTVTVLYVGADAAKDFYQRSNDEIFLMIFMIASSVLGVLALLSLGKGGLFSVIEAIGLFLMGMIRFALPLIYVKYVDCIRDPYSQEEVDADLARRAEIRRVKREEAAKIRQEKKEEKRRIREEAARKKAEEAARKAEEARKAKEEAARKAEEERKAKEEAARKAEEARKEAAKRAEEARQEAVRKAEEERRAKEEAEKKAEEERRALEARIAEQKAKEAQAQAEKDAGGQARNLAVEEANRAAQEIFGCSLEEWKKRGF